MRPGDADNGWEEDAPYPDPRDARIAELEAQLSAAREVAIAFVDCADDILGLQVDEQPDNLASKLTKHDFEQRRRIAELEAENAELRGVLVGDDCSSNAEWLEGLEEFIESVGKSLGDNRAWVERHANEYALELSTADKQRIAEFEAELCDARGALADAKVCAKLAEHESTKAVEHPLTCGELARGGYESVLLIGDNGRVYRWEDGGLQVLRGTDEWLYAASSDVALRRFAR